MGVNINEKETLKSWIKKRLEIRDDCAILISETIDCNNVTSMETIIMVFECCEQGKLQIYKICKPIEEVCEKDIQEKILSKKMFSLKRIKYNDIDWNNLRVELCK